MQATLPAAVARIADRIRDVSARHRAALRTRSYDLPALNPPTAPREVSWVTASDGARLRVHSYGPADGEAIVLVHGWTCCIEYWNPQINAFADDYRVIAYDLRGHGGSDPGTAALTTDLLADDLAAVLDATLHPRQRAVLVGHSLGGMTVQAWAERYRDQVAARADAVVLANTASGDLIAETTVVPRFNRGPLALPFPIGRLGLGMPLVFPPIEPVKWVFRHQIMSAAATGPVVDFALAIVRSCPSAVRSRFGFLLADLALQSCTRCLTVPTTVVAGTADDMTPPVHSRRLAEVLRSVGSLRELVELPVGHLGTVEAYEAFNDVLTGVLDDARATSRAARDASA
ncbi:alpha/beta fold hydrolase [Nocardia vermiculata]|uniref:Alpha/beta hydrolase n=1 Tax=Nocardia vermiculata TaxID=257274 RepID=A0A846YA20_9NOCA|nr:alpha/beta hydrolase [Nocardia vermiculata]NKY54068.1 alpha/beta hydrolase [Nocardia vermiculata]